MRRISIGDRFCGKPPIIHGITWEITGITDFGYNIILVSKGTHHDDVGTTKTVNHPAYSEDNWEYIGNFSKSSNFTNLYEILNSGE